MVEKEPTQEFTMPGLEAMTLKIWRNSRHSLELNRLIARRTKILIGLAAVAGTLLALAIFMLWHVLKQLG